jgi:hypothetical protein
MASVEAAEAGGDQTTPSRPPPTAIPMTGNSGAPLEHLVHPAVCKTMGSGAESASRLGTDFFSQMGPRWAGSGSEPWGPKPTPWPTAAPGGAGREGGALHRPYFTSLRAVVSPALVACRLRFRVFVFFASPLLPFVAIPMSFAPCRLRLCPAPLSPFGRARLPRAAKGQTQSSLVLGHHRHRHLLLDP